MKCEERGYAFYFSQNWAMMMTPPPQPPMVEKYTSTAKSEAYKIFLHAVLKTMHTQTLSNFNTFTQHESRLQQHLIKH